MSLLFREDERERKGEYVCEREGERLYLFLLLESLLAGGDEGDSGETELLRLLPVLLLQGLH